MRFAPVLRTYYLKKKSRVLQTLLLDFLHIFHAGAKLTEGTKFESELTIQVYSLEVLEVGAIGYIKVLPVPFVEKYTFRPKEHGWREIRTKAAELFNQDTTKIYPIRREFYFSFQTVAATPGREEAARVRGDSCLRIAKHYLERFTMKFHEECRIYYQETNRMDSDLAAGNCTKSRELMTLN